MLNLAGVRTAASALAIVLACLLAPVAIAASWVRTTVSDTDRYVATVGPLAEDAAVQEAMAGHLSQLVMDRVDGDGLLADAVADLVEERNLPPRTTDLLVLALEPVRERLGIRVHQLALDVVGGDAFASAWRDSNESAHRRLVAVLAGDETDSEAVALDLATAANTLRADLIERDVPFADRLPQVEASYRLAAPEQLARVRDGYQVLDTWATRFVVLALVVPAVGVAVARRRRRALAAWLGGSVVASLAVLVLLGVGRHLLLGRIEGDGTLAGPVWDILTDRLRWLLWVAVLVGSGALAVVTLTGPGERASAVRARLGRRTP